MSEVRTNWNTGQPIPAKDMRTNSEALAGLVSSPERAGSRARPNDARFHVQITARSSEGVFEFAQVRFKPGDGKVALVPGGVTHETLGLITAQGGQPDGGAGLVYVGDIVTIRPGVNIDSSGRVQWEFSPAAKMMPVDVATDGGDAGDDETPCTLTYTVTAEDGETLLTGASPQNQRRGTGEYAVADQGYIHYELESGVPTLTLGWVNEEYVGEPPEPDDNEGYNQSTGSASTEVDATKTPGGSDTQNDNGNLNFEGVSDTAQGQPQTSHIPVLTRVNKNGTTTDVWQWLDPDDLPVTYDGGSGGGANILDKLIEVQSTASTGLYTIDDADYSGRAGFFYIADANNTAANWADESETTTAQAFKVGTAETTDLTFFGTGGYSIIIDVSDGHKLKINVTTAPTAPNSDWIQIVVVKGARKTAADQTIP